MTDWRTILAEHGPAVWRTVYRLLDHHADALDCYQDTFLAAWRYAEPRRSGGGQGWARLYQLGASAGSDALDASGKHPAGAPV